MVPRRGTKTFAVPFVGVRYPTAVSLRAYCATKRKPIRSATTAATNQVATFSESGWSEATSPHCR